MPLLDHFRPPLSTRRHWESFHTAWAGALADSLNEEWLPEGYFAEEQVHPISRVEIDVATFEERRGAGTHSPGGAGIPATALKSWSPPVPLLSIPAVFPDRFEVLVFRSEGGPTLVAAIELLSPGNKDRPEHRRAFVTKCASYLHQGIGLALVDIVTTRPVNLHDELLRLLGVGPEQVLAPASGLYAAAYHPLPLPPAESDAPRAGSEGRIDVWNFALSLGGSLPTLPLFLGAELSVPVHLEATYDGVCRRRRLE